MSSMVLPAADCAAVVTRDNLPAHLKGVPFMARKAFAFAAMIRKGTLTVTLPDGLRLAITGPQ